ncbi:MAG: hypothetical protein ACXVCY_15590 [Pseudobdellovibrionaceae bacterium]
MKKNVMTAVLLIVSILFGSHPVHSKTRTTKNIKIAILDSGFCNDLLENPASVQINQPWFAVSSKFDLECNSSNLKKPRFHGHKVLATLLEEWQQTQDKASTVTLSISPIIMLDKNGQQSLKTWRRALQKIRKEKYDIVLSSIGLAFANISEAGNAKLTLPNGPTYFLAAGEKVGRLSHAEIFPQLSATLKNANADKKIHLVGIQFFDGKNWTHQPSTFYEKHVTDWTKDDSRPEYMGSSFATPRVLVHWIRETNNH